MRTVYLGTSEFAADVLRVLAGSPHAPQLVVTRPDRPRGRGRKLASPPVAGRRRASSASTTDQPESVNDDAARERIAAAAPEVVVVCAFGALIKEPLLSAHPMLNVHPSLLPRWRARRRSSGPSWPGTSAPACASCASPPGLDSGPVCLAAEEPIAADDTYGTLAARLAPLGGALLVQALDTSPPFHEQDEAGRHLRGEDHRRGSSAEPRPARRRARARRARAHAPHRRRADGGRWRPAERLGVWEADGPPAQPGDPAPGELSLDGRVPVLGCTPGTLELTMVQPAGRKAMPGDAYLRGLRS